MSISITIPQLPTAKTLAEIAAKSVAIAHAIGFPSGKEADGETQRVMPIAVQQSAIGRVQFAGDDPVTNDYPVGW